jgi:asparagine synthase (glutamine-hydrolysing)
MCGIFAVIGQAEQREKVNDALATLRRRGPDDQGVLAFPRCTLGQTRLSIVDLTEKGHQPMQDAHERIAITFNGEIYNYKELRETLEKKGYIFTTQSDTESILKAYLEYGEECVEHLDGMFAFIIWDDRVKKAFIARDRFGKKPLYYAHHDGSLVLASEIKALKAYGISPKINPQGLDAFLALMYLPPSMTFFTNVHTLPPAHCGNVTDGTLTARCYWSLTKKEPVKSISYDEAKEETQRLLKNAVQKRMRADVEVGAFLSGGVDSTLITAYAQQHTPHPIQTFSLGYGSYINELPFADEAARTIGTNHHTLQASADLINELENVLAYFDEPHADSADLAQHMLSAFTSQKVKVALAGDGGDELFMGYGWYFQYHNRPKLITLKNMLFSNQFAEHIKSITVFPPHLRTYFMRVASEHPWSYAPLSVETLPRNSAHAINAYDLSTYLPGQLLTKVDRTSMMHGLEVRCPLLDHQLAEFVYQLPEAYKMSHTTGKIILKDLLAEVMPRTFVDRKKQGFGAPVRKWLSEPGMQGYVRNKFNNKMGPLYDHLDRDRVQEFVESTLRGGNQKNYYRVWVLLCLLLWCESHI